MMITTNVKSNSSFKWTSRIIGFIWAFLTAGFAILNIYIFAQPQWIGDTLESPRAGHFGLYSYCVSTITDNDFHCHGTWRNFSTILNVSFAVATFFVGLSILLILICLGLFLLFFFIPPRFIYFICGFLQIICTICLFIALIIYPSGFDNDQIRSVCGTNVNDYYIDTCQIRWAYILAIIAFLNILILSIFAFLLALKQPINQLKHVGINSNSGQINEAFDYRTMQRH